jgi:hypothetical protein
MWEEALTSLRTEGSQSERKVADICLVPKYDKLVLLSIPN